MKPNSSLKACLAAAGLLTAHGAAFGQAEVITWTGTTGNLFDAANWDLSRVPGIAEIIEINNGGTATIGAGSGTNQLAGVHLGTNQDAAESGHVVMEGGFLRIGETPGDPKALIGNAANPSTFIMNGGTIFFDGPEMNPGNSNGKGVNELDWEVGERGVGRFEMHGTAVFRASDDLKIAENAVGNGSCLVDGTALITVGSGISISAGGTNEQYMVIAGNARVDSGNSMGAGSPEGQTDEGYLTMATGNGLSKLTIQENGILNIRRLTAREGVSTIIVKDRAQFHIFDVFNGAGAPGDQPSAARPAETGPNSTYGSAATSDATLTLQDDAIMTVNSDPASGPTKGLGLGAPRDAGNAGGKAVMIVRDRASFRVEQNLEVGTGAGDTSDGTVTVIGPNAKLHVGGDLKFALDVDGNPTLGRGALNPVITASTHAVINVAGTARLTNATLKVKLDGFTPTGAESYTLIQGGTVEGPFLATDFTEAPLGAGQSWKVEYTANSVVLKIEGGVTPPKAKIVWVSFHAADNQPSTAAAGAGFTEAPDVAYTRLLTASGYQVTRYVTTAAPDTNVLAAADLVIISRSVPSGNYQDAGAVAWNSVPRPMILMGGYILRNSRLGFTTGATIPDTTNTIRLRLDRPGHPIFAGVGLDAQNVMSNDYAGVVTFNGTLQRGISVNTDPLAGGGTRIASVGTAADPAAGGLIIGEWQAGATMANAAASKLADRRLVLLSGSREQVITSEGSGIYDLTPDGEKLFLNAVAYMATPLPTVAVAKNPDGTLSLNYTGTLLGAEAVNGPFDPVAGATSPHPVNPAAGPAAKFFRTQN